MSLPNERYQDQKTDYPEDFKVSDSLEPTENHPKRRLQTISYFTLVLLSLAASSLAFIRLYPQHLCNGHRISRSIAIKDEKNHRLLQFSPTHKEYVPVDALEFLLNLRDQPSALTSNTTSDRYTVAAELRASHSFLASISDDAILSLATRRGYRVGYIDVTDTEELTVTADSSQAPIIASVPYKTPSKKDHPDVASLLEQVSAEELRYIVGNLSVGFKTRYYKSSNARAPALWIQSYMSKLPGNNVTLFENSFDQPNVIGRLTPILRNASDATIVLGGHLDSVSQMANWLAPGADDDASGTAVMLHVLSILATSGWAKTYSNYPIEGHAYAGEEGGLIGSNNVARAYQTQGRAIRGMLNLEMVGWQPETKGSSTITVLNDPDQSMASHMSSVLKEYIPTADVKNTDCGYGCSDHYSWSKLGYPVVCIASYGPEDSNLNPNYHSVTDTIDKLDFDRMADFARAALAWVVEVASA